MKIQYRFGNLLHTDSKYIAHCVNAQGVMASGVAKEIKQKYPSVYTRYKQFQASKGLHLGSVIGVNQPDGKCILNIVGQQFYGREAGRVYISYTALRTALKNINKKIHQPISFPLIGCGLAGGDWKLVQSIIQQQSTNFQPIVYQLDDEVPW